MANPQARVVSRHTRDMKTPKFGLLELWQSWTMEDFFDTRADAEDAAARTLRDYPDCKCCYVVEIAEGGAS